MEEVILFLKRIYVLRFIIMWVYLLSYSYIDKYLELNSNFKPNINLTINYIITSASPIINTFAIILMIQEDIKLFKESRRN